MSSLRMERQHLKLLLRRWLFSESRGKAYWFLINIFLLFPVLEQVAVLRNSRQGVFLQQYLSAVLFTNGLLLLILQTTSNFMLKFLVAAPKDIAQRMLASER